MSSTTKFFLVLLLLTGTVFTALTALNPAAPREALQLLYSDGSRSWYLDTGSLTAKTEEETGVEYLEFTVKLTYSFTTNVDYLQYMADRNRRQWQPVSATGCDKDGNILEL